MSNQYQQNLNNTKVSHLLVFMTTEPQGKDEIPKSSIRPKHLHKILRVTLCFGELHLIHAFSGIPMQKGMPFVHGGELLMHVRYKRGKCATL
jgi:hypothetical protein